MSIGEQDNAGRVPPEDAHSSGDTGTHQRRNFLTIVAYQIAMRVGWIFKTESIIMPAIMDLLCGPATALAAWLRSWLPQLNRFGQSIPQLLFANRIRNSAHKKYGVALCSGLMGLIFVGLSLLWWINGGVPSNFMRISFLILYALFFICVGINNLGFNTLQGKLVKYDIRGRLFLFGNCVGGLAAITAAWFLLRIWLRDDGGDFVYIFGFTGICFLIGSGLTLICVEKRDDYAPHAETQKVNFLKLPFLLFKTNPQFRLLAIIAACFGTSMVLFPHYQALYRESAQGSSFEFSLRDLIVWVIIQNTGTVLFSLIAGPAADRFGNRLVLQLVLLLIALAPVVAIYLSENRELAKSFYFTVFLLVGVTPLTIRLLNNFALELAPADEHPRFLSALSLCIASPVIIFSQLVGWLLPIIGYSAIFYGIACLVFLGWGTTFFVSEPRIRLTSDIVQNDNL